ncbi:uncharacterized protein [Aristolochia californica]|uniref:uncharacterized protein n=1 Tax=Aristolochia californica TaxID=171875 RepID=UPI0035D7B234
MENQGKRLENDSPDLSSLDQNSERQGGPQSNEDGHSAWGSPTFQPVLLSDEERKIRIELETKIEKGLEEELKQGICHLALRLHSLYQNQEGNRKNAFTELNVTVRMEGESKIEIFEIKKGNCGKLRTLSPVAAHKLPFAGGFSWAKTLRSHSTSKMINQKNERTETPRQSWRITGSNCASLNNKKAVRDRRNMSPREGNKVLQLSWRK